MNHFSYLNKIIFLIFSPLFLFFQKIFMIIIIISYIINEINDF